MVYTSGIRGGGGQKMPCQSSKSKCHTDQPIFAGWRSIYVLTLSWMTGVLEPCVRVRVLSELSERLGAVMDQVSQEFSIRVNLPQTLSSGPSIKQGQFVRTLFLRLTSVWTHKFLLISNPREFCHRKYAG